MCTSIISNRNKTIVGFNLDILDMEYRVSTYDDGVYIEINDATEGWMPLFGANNRGEFVAMPTCWPHDPRSNPTGNETNVINLDIDLLLQKRTFEETKSIVDNSKICSVPGVTFQSQLTDKNGNVLQVIPGQGYNYYERPKYQVLTNFSPFKMDKELHPWMGLDRYNKAIEILENADDSFDVDDCFALLKEVSQTVCPTSVSMVFDVDKLEVSWCIKQEWNNIERKQL